MIDRFGIDPPPGLGRVTPDNTFLRLRDGPKRGREFPLHNLTSIVGRNNPPHTLVDIDLSDCELGDPPMISRQHAVLQWIDGGLQILDLNSRNGSWVNEKKLLPPRSDNPSPSVTLSSGDVIKLGNLEFEVITHD